MAVAIASPITRPVVDTCHPSFLAELHFDAVCCDQYDLDFETRPSRDILYASHEDVTGEFGCAGARTVMRLDYFVLLLCRVSAFGYQCEH